MNSGQNLKSLRIVPGAPTRGSIRPPGSKSITNRALVCAALAAGETVLTGALDSEDTRVMIDSLGKLGIAVTANSDRTILKVAGLGGVIPAADASLYVANSGTTVRFLTAMLALGRGTYRLDGTARMRERPIQDLLDALQELGCAAASDGGNGCPPITISARGLPGGQVSLRGDTSSQFLSGLLMAAPYAETPLTIRVTGELVSVPYVEMTMRVMEAFGVAVERPAPGQYDVPAGRHYLARSYAVEPDASAASYFFAAAAITGGRVTVEGLNRESLQGDVGFCDCLRRMGCQVDFGEAHITVQGGPLRGIDVDMGDISDTAQTLAAVALFADRPTTVSGIGHVRHKETDRIGNLAVELRKLGAEVTERDDGYRIVPGALRSAEIDTYADHRMAMSLALAGLRGPGLMIRDPNCVEKTYPRFFEDLNRVCPGCVPSLDG